MLVIVVALFSFILLVYWLQVRKMLVIVMVMFSLIVLVCCPQVLKMLVIVVVMFVICWLPFQLFYVVLSIFPDVGA